MVTRAIDRDGYAVFPIEEPVLAWANAAYDVARGVLQAPLELRHGDTWFVGVDALPNNNDGSIGGVPLDGTWRTHVEMPLAWHRAQLSIVFPGYPRRDTDESEAAHRYRLNRDAAHVDGLLPDGPNKRRHLREPHGFILGLPLNDVTASPLVVWPGSHLVMGRAFAVALADHDPKSWGNMDVTEAYQAARRTVFEQCQRIEVNAKPGQAILMHRHLLHGTAPWGRAKTDAPRKIAYFRPQIAMEKWLSPSAAR